MNSKAMWQLENMILSEAAHWQHQASSNLNILLQCDPMIIRVVRHCVFDAVCLSCFGLVPCFSANSAEKGVRCPLNPSHFPFHHITCCLSPVLVRGLSFLLRQVASAILQRRAIRTRRSLGLNAPPGLSSFETSDPSPLSFCRPSSSSLYTFSSTPLEILCLSHPNNRSSLYTSSRSDSIASPGSSALPTLAFTH
jgi:hypothetical protein